MDLTDAQQVEILSRYRGYLLNHARSIAPYRPNEWQDLAQEGWVAMWRALKSFDPDKGAEATWLTTAARLRMAEVLARGTWTGTPMARGHVRESPPTPVDTSSDWADGAYIEKAYDEVWTAYHQGEIADALSQLDPKVRIFIEQKIMADSGRYNWRTHVSQLDLSAKKLLTELLNHLDPDS